MKVTLRQLSYFIAAVDSGSLTGAAAKLHVAPTAVSLQIKALEDRFGVVLLDRHSRGVQPTPLGADLLDRARRILALVAETERALDARPAAARTLRMGVPPAVARLVGVEVVLDAAARFDGMKVQVTEGWSGDLVGRLASGNLDALLGYGVLPGRGYSLRPLLEEHFVFAAAPGLAGGPEPVTLEAVLGTDLVFYGRQSVSWRVLSEAAAGVLPHHGRKREVESIDVWRSLLCRGLGTAITPFGAIADEHARGEIAVREIAGTPIVARLSLALRPGAMAAREMRAFGDFLAGVLAAKLSGLGPYYRFLPDPDA
jgi:LysR family nitrogen assimilation transcriptional regulator